MVDRGSNDGQSQRDVHGLAEPGVFEDRQSLVMVHGQHRVRVFQVSRCKQGIGRERAYDLKAPFLKSFQYR